MTRVVTNIPPANSSTVVPMDPDVAMIERILRDPTVPMERLERAVAMRERLLDRYAEGEFNEAMAAVQMEITPIARDSFNPHTRTRYASYFAIDKVIRPVLGRHGIRVSFNESEVDVENHVRIVAIVSKGRHTERYHYDSPIITTGAKGQVNMTLTHAKASAVTYGRRYLMGMIFNLSTSDDDDGNAAGNELISDEQLTRLEAFARELHANFEAFCKVLKVPSLDQLPAHKFDDAMAKLNEKKKQMAKEQQP